MQINQTKKPKLITVVLIVNLAATLMIILYLSIFTVEKCEIHDVLDFGSGTQYILYIGTNDKDTYQQIISTEDAREIVNEICSRYVEGYTASEVQGGWFDESGILTQETTFVYTFTGAEETEIISIMREVLTALNQNSILIEKREVASTFYNGIGQ